MAILKDPLFSEEARGQVAKAAVFKRSSVHPVFSGFFYHPINWSSSKIAHAQAWKFLCNQWRALSEEQQASWRDIAPGVLTGFNYFMQCKGVPFYDGHSFGWDPGSTAWLKILVDSAGRLIVTS